MQHCTECHNELPAGARFCIECSAPVCATGKTERLGMSLPGKIMIFEGNGKQIAMLVHDKPLGRLNGEWIYDYSYEVWSDPNFIVAVNPFPA
jgi:hypothetical protein